MNVADLSRTLGMPQTTLQRYLALLHATFLIQLLPAWTGKMRKRLRKSAKILAVDTGLASHLVGMDRRRLLTSAELWGSFVEGFIAMELFKQTGWSKTQPRLYHFRTAKGEDVDVVAEAPSGALVGIEVKATMSIDARDFRGLRILAEVGGPRFLRGVVLYLGDQAVPFGTNLYTLFRFRLCGARSNRRPCIVLPPEPARCVRWLIVTERAVDDKSVDDLEPARDLNS